jgi:hypothetical protein
MRRLRRQAGNDGGKPHIAAASAGSIELVVTRFLEQHAPTTSLPRHTVQARSVDSEEKAAQKNVRIPAEKRPRNRVPNHLCGSSRQFDRRLSS